MPPHHTHISRSRTTLLLLSLSAALLLLASRCVDESGGGPRAIETTTVRVAYLPNVTHLQPLVGMERGFFQQELGQVRIETRLFNAGPSVIEALLGGHVDIAYVGPSPAVNGYIQSQGRALRVIAGAVSGGASLVVRVGSGISSVADLSGKRIASPQLGNTQDIALRWFLAERDLKPKEQGGSVTVLPVRNPDILSLFLRKELDAAWVPEPWASRLVAEAGGLLLLDERDLWPGGQFAATVVVARTAFLVQNPELTAHWLQGHIRTTLWAQQHPLEAQQAIANAIERLSRVRLSPDVIASAWSRMSPVTDPLTDSIVAASTRAHTLGYLKGDPGLGNLVELSALRRAEQALAQVATADKEQQ